MRREEKAQRMIGFGYGIAISICIVLNYIIIT